MNLWQLLFLAIAATVVVLTAPIVLPIGVIVGVIGGALWIAGFILSTISRA